MPEKPLVKFDSLASSGNNLLHLVVMAHTVVQISQRTLEKGFVNRFFSCSGMLFDYAEAL